jgi:hypothetical protein
MFCSHVIHNGVASTEYKITAAILILLCLWTSAHLVKSILLCANPSIQVEMSSSEVPLGGSVEVKWLIGGAVERISNFEIVLL